MILFSIKPVLIACAIVFVGAAGVSAAIDSSESSPEPQTITKTQTRVLHVKAKPLPAQPHVVTRVRIKHVPGPIVTRTRYMLSPECRIYIEKVNQLYTETNDFADKYSEYRQTISRAHEAVVTHNPIALGQAEHQMALQENHTTRAGVLMFETQKSMPDYRKGCK